MLSTLDITIIGMYFIVLLLIGYFSSRKESKEDFLIGSRSVTAFQSVATIGSSLIGAGMLLSYIALVFKFGAGAIWLFIGYVFGFAIFYRFAKYLKPLADKHKFYTLPDFFYFRFGKSAGRLTAATVILISLGWISINFIGGGRIIESFTGFSFNYSTIVVGLVIATYLYFGGFRAVVSTDSIQFIGLLILAGLLVYLLMNYSVTLTAEDVNIFNISFGELISFFLVGVIVPLASGDLWQRIYAVNDLKTFRTSTIWLSVFLIFIGIVLLLIGLIIKKNIPDALPDTALVEGLNELLPLGWKGLAVVVFYSTIMSSADSYLFAASTSITRDILYRGNEKNTVQQSRIWIFVLAILGVILAIFIQQVLNASYFLVALMFALSTIVLVVWQKKSIRVRPVTLGLLFGLLGVVIGTFTIGISELLIAFAVGGALLGLGIGAIKK